MAPPIDPLEDLEREYNSLKISTLKSAVDISPYVHEVTIGPDAINSDSANKKNTSPKRTKSYNNGDSALFISPKLKEDKMTGSSHLVDHLLHACEVQQKETVDVMVKSMVNKMVNKRLEIMAKFWHQQELELERKAQERRNREREILQQMALGDKLAQLERERLDAENRAISERMKKLLEKQVESTKMFEELDGNHSDICMLYQEITNISAFSNTDVYLRILQNYDQQLQNSLSAINSLAENCKSGNIKEEDVKKSFLVKDRINEIKQNILREYQEALIEIENSKEVKTPENSQHSLNDSQPRTLEESQNKLETVNYCSKSSLAYYLELHQYLETFEQSYKDLLSDNKFKKFRFDCQKAVNTPVNSISSVSGPHLKDKFDKLAKLLNGDRVKVGDEYVTCSMHPQGRSYCMNLLAKKIVRQGDQTVSSNPDAAFPIASVTVALWAHFPELGKLICAHFHRECPYLVPLFLPHSSELSDEEYYKARGYKYDDGGVVEKQDKFLKRMSGIFRLCAAIWITKMPYSVQLPHPQGLCHAWRWMAAFINLEPEADITATLLFDFLSICGSEFYKFYKNQFVKVLQYLVNDYRKRIDKIDEGGPKVRLEVFLQNVIKDGKILPPVGVLSERVW